MEFELEDRICERKGCSNTFRVMKSSADHHCSTYCREISLGNSFSWRQEKANQLQALFGPKMAKSGITGNGGKQDMLKKSELEPEPKTNGYTMLTKKKKLSAKENIIESTEKRSGNFKGSGMQEIGKKKAKKSRSEKSEETPPVACTDVSKDMPQGVSESLNLLDNSANHLFSLMQKIEKNDKFDFVEGTKATVSLALELREAMKLKLAVLREIQ